VTDEGSARPLGKIPARIMANGLMQRTEFSTYVNHDDIVIKARDFPVPAALLKLQISQGDRVQAVSARECGNGVLFCFKPLNHELPLLLRFELSDGRQVVEAKQKVLQALLLKADFAQEVHFRDFAAEFGAGTVREPAVLLLEPVALRPEFPVLAGPMKSDPVNFAFLDTVRFKFKVPAGTERQEQLGIFKYLPLTKRWNYIATQADAEPGYLSCRVLTAGTFALLRDIFPPSISFRKTRSRVLSKIKRLAVRISDKGKGVDENSITVSLNGRDMDVDYDPDRNQVLIQDFAALQKGKNRLLVRASDRAGNRTENNYVFTLK
jgi:hypothetical protein